MKISRTISPSGGRAFRSISSTVNAKRSSSYSSFRFWFEGFARDRSASPTSAILCLGFVKANFRVGDDSRAVSIILRLLGKPREMGASVVSGLGVTFAAHFYFRDGVTRMADAASRRTSQTTPRRNSASVFPLLKSELKFIEGLVSGSEDSKVACESDFCTLFRFGDRFFSTLSSHRFNLFLSVYRSACLVWACWEIPFLFHLDLLRIISARRGFSGNLKTLFRLSSGGFTFERRFPSDWKGTLWPYHLWEMNFSFSIPIL